MRFCVQCSVVVILKEIYVWLYCITFYATNNGQLLSSILTKDLHIQAKTGTGS